MHIVIIGKAALERRGLAKIISEKIENAQVTDVIELVHDRSGQPLAVDMVILCLSQLDSVSENLLRLRSVSKRYSKSRILVLENVSGRNPFRNLRNYANSGFDGYVTSMDPLEEFETSINKVLSGSKYICPDGLEQLLGLALATDRETIALTENELDVAGRLLEGCSVSKIARETNRKASTISTIKKNILRKTNTQNVIMLGEVLNLEPARNLAKRKKALVTQR
ncbi:LuxR C-terminal-related transcriptional regulator [Dyadobacter sp. CY312]|uniref:LuxR C-terminal-related transcriptional regulator n=1 Tax=Dyadobacter sp. CY312 TaxID=2907303 RepID=UPI001F16E9B3|nr:LuxR C-terminal-related transcriptional regulator [Dyadobacter sp. CY312]MCE7039131.1 LuxR C-terminal-related transcriptional regulator [Dyadobacter sp. CY312]